jgi:hypothetical protein
MPTKESLLYDFSSISVMYLFQLVFVVLLVYCKFSIYTGCPPKKLALFDLMYRKNYKSYCTHISFIVFIKCYVLFRYTMPCTRETIKHKLFDLLLIEAYSKGERRPTL